jgi:hypothetical protein
LRSNEWDLLPEVTKEATMQRFRDKLRQEIADEKEAAARAKRAKLEDMWREKIRIKVNKDRKREEQVWEEYKARKAEEKKANERSTDISLPVQQTVAQTVAPRTLAGLDTQDEDWADQEREYHDLATQAQKDSFDERLVNTLFEDTKHMIGRKQK